MPDRSTDRILEVRNLDISFYTERGEVHAIRNASYSLSRGEILGMVGESGSGKSVSLLALMGLLPKSISRVNSGEAWFTSDGIKQDLLSLDKRGRRAIRGSKIAMIFQEPMSSLNPVMKCGQQIVEMLRVHKKMSRSAAQKRAMALLEEVQIRRPEKIFKSYPHQISGGQKQRVMIAMAISCEPDLLIADEPTTALDVTVQKEIIHLLKELQAKRGMSIIFVTHDLGVIAEIADRVEVMCKGEVVEFGLTESIFKSPIEPYTKGLLACRPPVDKRLKHLPTVQDFMDCQYGKDVGTMLDERVESLKERTSRHEKIYSNEPLFQIKDLTKVYQTRQAWIGNKAIQTRGLDHVNFEIYPGETLGLVGESGCGKSTLGRTILRLQNPTSGQVFFKGKEIFGMSKEERLDFRRKCQIIFQDPYSSLNPRKSIGKAIMEPMMVHGILNNSRERKIRAMELLEKVGLDIRHFSRYPHEFSGGQRQRICIARTLAVNPEFIVCDESVSALDVSVQAMVLNLLNELKEEFGFTFVFISHDLSVVKFMSDRMLVMQHGKIVEYGEADEVYANPKTDYAKRLISAIPGHGRHDLSGKVSSDGDLVLD